MHLNDTMLVAIAKAMH